MEEPVSTTPITPTPEPQDNRFKLGKREIVFIIIIVLLLGAAAFYTWKISQDDKKAAQSINNFAECAAAGNPIMESYPEQCAAGGKTFTNTDQQAPSAPDQQQASEVFKIPELGVQFSLTPEISSLYYYIFADKPTIAYFSLNEFKGTDCAADKVSIGALSKLTKAEAEAYEALTGTKDTMQEINDSFYQTANPQAACSDDMSVQAKASAAQGSLMKAIKTTLTAIE